MRNLWTTPWTQMDAMEQRQITALRVAAGCGTAGDFYAACKRIARRTGIPFNQVCDEILQDVAVLAE